MVKTIVGIFMILHGLVHLLYSAHSLRRIELREGLAWPDGSWAFSRLLGEGATRWLAAIIYAVCTLLFAVAGLALLLGQDWWRSAAVAAAALSSAGVLLFWDGKPKQLSDQGLIALIINVVIAAVALLVPATTLGF